METRSRSFIRRDSCFTKEKINGSMPVTQKSVEGIKNPVEALMAEEGEGVSLPETNKREQSTETKEAVRTMKRKKKHHGMELLGGILEDGRIYKRTDPKSR